MTLGRLVVAWIVVAAWFELATFMTAYVVAKLTVAQQGFVVAVPSSLLKWRLAEAALLSLIASLWFDSLGGGQWWLLFLLIGALITISSWSVRRATEDSGRALIVGAVADVSRYVIAGGLLAWRLS